MMTEESVLECSCKWFLHHITLQEVLTMDEQGRMEKHMQGCLCCKAEFERGQNSELAPTHV